MGYKLEDGPISHLGVYCEDNGAPSTPTGEFVPDPVDGRSSARCAILPGTGPYDNIHCYTNLRDLPFTPPLTYHVNFKLPAGTCNNSPEPSLVQGVEFSMSRYRGGRRWEWALQLENVNATPGDGAPQWRVWRPSDSSWQPIGVAVPTDVCDGNEWHSFEMRGRIASSEQIRFDSFAVDGSPQTPVAPIEDRDPVPAPGEPDRFAAAIQVDSNGSGQPYAVHVDDLSLTPTYQLFGLDFSPYVDGQDPAVHSQITETQLRQRMELISPYVRWVRSFGCGDGLERTGKVAHELGLHVALGAWIGRDTSQNDAQLDCLIARVNAGDADLAIVGSEALLRDDVPADTLLGYIARVKAETAGSGVEVATADTDSELLTHPSVMDASQVLLPNIHPYWAGVRIEQAVRMLHTRYRQLRAAAPGKPIIVSETGWPSCGAVNGEAVPSPQNAADYLLRFVSWARAESVDALYFDALDESWKTGPEGPVGACWGIADKSGVLKPGMERAFSGDTVPCDWGCACDGAVPPGGHGTPLIEFTRIPPYGSSLRLHGRELHAPPACFYVAVYLRVAGGWWTKPTFAQPRTFVNSDGTWATDVDTGGIDRQATDYAAFLLPDAYTPPALGGQPSLPAELADNAVAPPATVTRTPTRPVASFGYTPITPQSGEKATFTSQSTDPDGTIVAQDWDLDGDGQFDDAHGAIAEHVFSGPGDHAVGLMVTDDNGETDTNIQTVPVDPDATPPGAPALTGTEPPSPAHDDHPRVHGIAEPDTTIALYTTPDCAGDAASRGSATDLASTGIEVRVPPNETTHISAVAIDQARRRSDCSNAIAYTEDSTAPPAPSFIATTPASPANDNTPTITGTAEPGSTVRLFKTTDCSGADTAHGPAATFTTPGFTITVPDDTTTTLRATATDAAGNTSPCSAGPPPDTITYTEDSTAPPTPSFIATTPASPANDNTPTITGTAEPGSTVRLFKTADCSGADTAHGPAATFTTPGFTITVPDDTTTTLRATATDAAGNTSPCSAGPPPDTITYTEDSTAPQTTITSGPADGATIDERTATFAFTSSEPASSFACRLEPPLPGTWTACASPRTTTWSGDGSYGFCVRATDAAGNTDASPDCRTITIATLQPPPSCAHGGRVVILTDRSDRWTGTSGDEIVFGREGDDSLHGLGGSDCLYGEPGADRLVGGSGSDRLFGGPGNDRIAGGPGDDRLSGGAGNDRIDDASGRDTVLGGAGNDRIDVRDRRRSARLIADTVRCGSGSRDLALVDRRDRVGRDCERVRRR